MNHTLPFPSERPPSYIKLENEPVFDARKHLSLGAPETILSLSQLGYTDAQVKDCPTAFGVSTAFKILSDEGVAVMHETCNAMYHNRNVSVGTGVNRLGSYVRGAGYRSQFIKDFCESPELAEHLSSMAGVSPRAAFSSRCGLRRQLRTKRYKQSCRQLACRLGGL